MISMGYTPNGPTYGGGGWEWGMRRMEDEVDGESERRRI
jgi:hypothetical protein